MTPLMQAIASGELDEIERQLRDASLFDTDDAGRTALFYAAETGDEEIVWMVLRQLPGTGLFCARGQLLELTDNHGKLAEQWAAECGHAAIAELLAHERVRIDKFE